MASGSHSDYKEDGTKQKSLSEAEGQRLVVIGKTGSGISSIANIVLNKKHFESKISMKSVTTMADSVELIRQGKKIIVVNTPGMFNTKISNDEVKEQLKESIYMAAPGPHLFLYPFPLGRQTYEEEETIKEIVDVFGSDFFKYTVIAFTGTEYLMDTTIEHYITEMPDFVRNFLTSCSSKYITLNYPLEDPENQKSIETIFMLLNEHAERDKYFSIDRLMKPYTRIESSKNNPCKCFVYLIRKFKSVLNLK